MANLRLPELVEAIASAVIEAQDRIDQHQLALLRRYFDEDDRPRSATMLVPSLSLHDKRDVRINIPWLALMRPNLLSISEVQVDFEVELADFKTPQANPSKLNDDTNKFPDTPTAGEMMVEVGVPIAKKSGTIAKVGLKVTAQEPSEGLARMINEFVKRIMVVGE